MLPNFVNLLQIQCVERGGVREGVVFEEREIKELFLKLFNTWRGQEQFGRHGMIRMWRHVLLKTF